MDTETEERLTQLQICIDGGHSYEIDREASDDLVHRVPDEGSVVLLCSVCGYIKVVELTRKQTKDFAKLSDDEDGLLEAILKNDKS